MRRKRGGGRKKSWGGKEGGMNLDVLELKHVSLDKGAADLLIGPSDE